MFDAILESFTSVASLARVGWIIVIIKIFDFVHGMSWLIIQSPIFSDSPDLPSTILRLAKLAKCLEIEK
jgi:hypothetical protein